MSKSLYPTSLFHFTNEKMSFESIIRQKAFKLSYAKENIYGPKTRNAFCTPMVSFCDIRLSQLDKHTESYGFFGIGLSKDWAERNKLNPVIYMNKECDLVDRITNQYRYLRKMKDYMALKNKVEYKKIAGFIEDNYRTTIDTLKFMKNYSGALHRKDKPPVYKYIFADEREWRYIPEFSESNQDRSFIPEQDTSYSNKEILNSEITGITLEFDFDDVKYMIVESENDVSSLIKILESMSVDNKHYRKIMCSTQINDDL